MTRSATAISRCARALVLASALTAAQAQARGGMAQDEPDMVDVARTPLADLNLAKDPIPPLLLAAVVDPYDSEGLDDCGEIGGKIAELDAILGADYDVAWEERDRVSVGRIAQSAVGSFIPFRSILREITGAADHQRDFQEAIVAGAVRRGYLKGLGEQRGCAYPARPAFARVAVTGADMVDTDGAEAPLAMRAPPPPPVEPPQTQSATGVTFVSEPVVQDVPRKRSRKRRK